MATQLWLAEREDVLIAAIATIGAIREALAIENAVNGGINPHNRDHWNTMCVNAQTLATRANGLVTEIAKLI